MSAHTAFQRARGPWLQTASGAAFYPLDPRPADVRLCDIAHALSHLCRYAGHTSSFYSVAQHSVLMARHLLNFWRYGYDFRGSEVCLSAALWALLHDASEAYLVDVPRPIKPYLTNYYKIEERVTRAIAAAFGLPASCPPLIKLLDNAILGDEAAQLMTTPPRDWGLTHDRLGIVIEPWTPAQARREFLETFRDLTFLKRGAVYA